VDLSALTSFERKAVEALCLIPRGRLASYSYLADIIGHSGAFRAVGSAMAKNPLPVIYPCHRVVGKDGHIWGFSAGGGLVAKRIMLLNEQVVMRDALHVDMGFMLS
jgi:methylated-DNA-[protein]-cysteine S-methyltransferase